MENLKFEEKLLIFEIVMDILKNPRWPPKIFKIVNICTIINIFDTHEEQKLFFIKKYTFTQTNNKVMSLRKWEKSEKVCFFMFFSR